ncbi:MAG: phosphoesterase [Candidatus Staskawiczbacteria bacterium]|nr:phosphoesterase [Candidatus Staskawiczbacteria bacterium]
MKDEELVLVVPSDVIFRQGRWQGLKTDNLDYYLDLIKKNCQFKRRGDVEEDPSFQQIIPYIVFNFKDKYFIYKYLEQAGEKRLVDSYQLGVGGHINPVDTNGSDILEAGMMREWSEEVEFKGNLLEKRLVGILNDDSRPVEAVHLGLVYKFVGDSPDILVKEIDKIKGELVDLKNIGEYIKDNPGVWVQVVYKEYLTKNLG